MTFPTSNGALIPTFDTGSTAVLTGLRCCDRGIWHDAVDLRMATVGLADPDLLQRLIDSLDGPTVYDELVAERGGIR